MLSELVRDLLERIISFTKEDYGERKGLEAERVAIAFAKYLSISGSNNCFISPSRLVEALRAVGIAKKDVLKFALAGIMFIKPWEWEANTAEKIGQCLLQHFLKKYPAHNVFEKCSENSIMIAGYQKLRPVSPEKEEISARLLMGMAGSCFVNVDGYCFTFSP
ncbi:MAG: hypothetical protein LRS41_00125 [Caldisphaeraceae archaeon]|nr:hypothetical protein [Caldisphaeraceae archaeon]